MDKPHKDVIIHPEGSAHNRTFTEELQAYKSFIEHQPRGFVYDGITTTKEHSSMSKADQLQALRDKYKGCMQCPLATQGRSQVVFGHGNPNASLVFVGEGPGRDEDKQGVPFIGRAGQLLTKIIEAMEIQRSDVYISNVVKCRPPENRAPLPNESQTCSSILLMKELAIIQPQIICTLGATATAALLGKETKISQARGQFHTFNGYLVLPTYHPAYLLRNPAEKRVVWEDMKVIIAKLAELNLHANGTVLNSATV